MARANVQWKSGLSVEDFCVCSNLTGHALLPAFLEESGSVSTFFS